MLEVQKEIPTRDFKTGRSQEKEMVTAVGTSTVAVFRREVGNWNWALAIFQVAVQVPPGSLVIAALQPVHSPG